MSSYATEIRISSLEFNLELLTQGLHLCRLKRVSGLGIDQTSLHSSEDLDRESFRGSYYSRCFSISSMVQDELAVDNIITYRGSLVKRYGVQMGGRGRSED